MNINELTSKRFISKIGESINKIRCSKNLTIEQLAANTGISRLTLSKIERGEANPTINIIWKLCTELNTTLAELTNYEEEISLSKANSENILESIDKSFKIDFVFREEKAHAIETFRIYLTPNNKTTLTEKHNKGSIEIITVMEGSLLITINQQEFKLEKFDSLKFEADKEHSYKNLSTGITTLNSIIKY
ncbi:MAG: helix-turn-helix domain-containing protein [Clostridium sp.]